MKRRKTKTMKRRKEEEEEEKRRGLSGEPIYVAFTFRSQKTRCVE